jgi:hypothetical protein
MTQLDKPCELEEDGGVALIDDETFERGKECVYRGEEEGEGEGVEVDLLLEEQGELREVSWALESNQRGNILTMRRRTKKKAKKILQETGYNTL